MNMFSLILHCIPDNNMEVRCVQLHKEWENRSCVMTALQLNHIDWQKVETCIITELTLKSNKN